MKMKKICLSVLLAMLAIMLFGCDVEVHVHAWGEPEITESGDKIYTCTGCSKTKTESHTHTWGDPIVDAVGDTVYTCSKCKATKTEPHEHKYQTTYTSDLAEHWHACSVKGCLSRILQASHEWDDGTVTKKPTEETVGERTHACTVCGHTRKEEMNKLPIKMPRFEWNAGFAFDNVRVEYRYRGETREEDYDCDYLIDGALVQMVDEEGTDIIALEFLLQEIDFSDHYDAFVHNGNGVYTAERVEWGEYWVMVDVEVIFVGGVLDCITYAYEDENALHSYFFSDRGEIEIALPVLDAKTLADAFAASNFGNYTVGKAEMTAEMEMLYVETWMFDGADFFRFLVDTLGGMDTEYGSEQSAGWVKLPELDYLGRVLSADIFTYDVEMGAFVSNVRFEEFMDTETDVVSICLSIEDGHLAYLVLECADGTLVSYYFTDYGVTEIPPEEELEDEPEGEIPSLSNSDLEEAFDSDKFGNYTMDILVLEPDFETVRNVEACEFDGEKFIRYHYDQIGNMISESGTAPDPGLSLYAEIAALGTVLDASDFEYDPESGCFYSETPVSIPDWPEDIVGVWVMVEDGYLTYLAYVHYYDGAFVSYSFSEYGTTEVVVP